MVKLPQKQTEFEQPPAGNHLGICYMVLDLGTQESQKYGPKRRIRIQWELPLEPCEDGRPHVIGRTYTLSSSDKSALMHDLQSWRGRPFTDDEYGSFDIADVIGAPCMLNVVADDKYSNVSAVAPLPRGMSVPKLANDPIHFSFDIEPLDVSSLEKLSDHWREKIEASPEYAAATGQPSPAMSETVSPMTGAVDAAVGTSYEDPDIPF